MNSFELISTKALKAACAPQQLSNREREIYATLSFAEFKPLRTMVNEIYPTSDYDSAANLMKVLICKIRSKGVRIENIRGKGYRLAA